MFSNLKGQEHAVQSLETRILAKGLRIALGSRLNQINVPWTKGRLMRSQPSKKFSNNFIDLVTLRPLNFLRKTWPGSIKFNCYESMTMTLESTWNGFTPPTLYKSLLL